MVGHDPDGFADGADAGGTAEGSLCVFVGELGCDVDELACGNEVLGDDLGVGLLQRAQLPAGLGVQLLAGDALGDGRLVPAFAAGAAPLPIIALAVVAALVIPAEVLAATPVVPAEVFATTAITAPEVVASAAIVTAAIVTAEPFATTTIIAAPIVPAEPFATSAPVIAAEAVTTTAAIAPAVIARTIITPLVAPEVLATSAAVAEATIITLRAGLLMVLAAAAGTLMPAVVAARAVL
ncbi:hypothetical protein [Brevibacterium sp. UBA7493]|uniref:Uncharacterized protein n=1 Tax=Brevibacterium luteolum TaxID=199591 RepID=A0A2N6PLH0_9MICO|nr:hypothetical protein [Brevibacterium sp. UBA7493]PMB99527.1 hypothetical protein CJ198_03185 [Brevibacterium luteolum]